MAKTKLQAKEGQGNQAFFKGRPVVYRAFSGAIVSRNQIYKIVDKLRTKYADKHFTMQVSINVPLVGFRSCKSFKYNENINLGSDYDWETTDAFVVYCWQEADEPRNPREKQITNETFKLSESEMPKPEPPKNKRVLKGNEKIGTTVYNDCLYECIEKLIGKYAMPKNFKTPEDIKRRLNLKRDDKIPINFIPEIENIYKLNIYITGDFEYISENKYPNVMYLNVKDEHVELVEFNNHTKQLIEKIPQYTQKLTTYNINGDVVNCYDEDGYFTITYKEMINIKTNYGRGHYVNQRALEFVAKEEDLKNKYDEIMEDNEILKRYSYGKMDLSRSGWKYKNEILKNAFYGTMALREPEKIQEYEEEWIYNSFRGGLIFTEECDLKFGQLIDINSYYPYLLSSKEFTFPVGKGELVNLTSLNAEFLNYGIYKCVITRSNDYKINRLFSFNKENFYTHYDLNLARMLNLDIKLIVDGLPNAILYRTRGNGHMYFNKIVSNLYNMKLQMKNDGVKSKVANKLLHLLWGVMCSKNKVKTPYGEKFDLGGDNIAYFELRGINEKMHGVYCEKGDFYKYSWARLGTFLTSLARFKLASVILPINEYVVRCHTDSILTSLETLPPNITIGQELGAWKIENCGKVKVIKRCKPKFY